MSLLTHFANYSIIWQLVIWQYNSIWHLKLYKHDDGDSCTAQFQKITCAEHRVNPPSIFLIHRHGQRTQSGTYQQRHHIDDQCEQFVCSPQVGVRTSVVEAQKRLTDMRIHSGTNDRPTSAKSEKSLCTAAFSRTTAIACRRWCNVPPLETNTAKT